MKIGVLEKNLFFHLQNSNIFVENKENKSVFFFGTTTMQN